ncbi:hypothetical protein [Alloalcanivorax venustensis]|jgi:hypothetical protein
MAHISITMALHGELVPSAGDNPVYPFARQLYSIARFHGGDDIVIAHIP